MYAYIYIHTAGAGLHLHQVSCVYIHACMHACMYVCMHTHTQTHMQTMQKLADGSGLIITVAKYETPKHTDINKVRP